MTVLLEYLNAEQHTCFQNQRFALPSNLKIVSFVLFYKVYNQFYAKTLVVDNCFSWFQRNFNLLGHSLVIHDK